MKLQPIYPLLMRTDLYVITNHTIPAPTLALDPSILIMRPFYMNPEPNSLQIVLKFPPILPLQIFQSHFHHILITDRNMIQHSKPDLLLDTSSHLRVINGHIGLLVDSRGTAVRMTHVLLIIIALLPPIMIIINVMTYYHHPTIALKIHVQPIIILILCPHTLFFEPGVT